MSVTIRVPASLRDACRGSRELRLAADSVRSALEQIESTHPELHRSVCDETGSVRRHVGVFVNQLHLRSLQGLDTRLEPGDVVTILPAVSGG